MEYNYFDFIRSYCKRAGMNEDDTEDCGIQFEEHMLSKAPPESGINAWMNTCARHYVTDY